MVRYRLKRTYVWSHNIAYLVGLITSDGCLYTDGRHIEITSVDYEQLENFCIVLGRSIPITRKMSGAGKMAYRIQFSDVALYDFLLSTGLRPAKSNTLHFLDVPREFFAEFLRGLFDGDGSAYGYFDKRWASSYMFYLQFVGANRQFMQWLADRNAAYFGVSHVRPRRSARVWQISYAKHDTRILSAVMYPHDQTVSLTRKRTKLQGFISHK